MAHESRELKFVSSPEKEDVSALLLRPGEEGQLLVLGHWASTNTRRATLRTVAERMNEAGIATFRARPCAARRSDGAVRRLGL